MHSINLVVDCVLKTLCNVLKKRKKINRKIARGRSKLLNPRSTCRRLRSVTNERDKFSSLLFWFKTHSTEKNFSLQQLNLFRILRLKILRGRDLEKRAGGGRNRTRDLSDIEYSQPAATILTCWEPAQLEMCPYSTTTFYPCTETSSVLLDVILPEK